MHNKIILMKKISAILLSAVLILTACHNDGSSTVGVYENDEPKEATEHNKGHEGHKGHKEKMNEGHMADTATMHHSVDSAETHSTDPHAAEAKKEAEKH